MTGLLSPLAFLRHPASSSIPQAVTKGQTHMNDASMRVTALEMAARLGLPYEMTLRAARSYLAFLKGTENAGGEWSLASAGASLPPDMLKRAKASFEGLTGTRAAAKKAQPKKSATVMRRAKR